MADHRSTDPGVEQIILRAEQLNENRQRAFLAKLRREHTSTLAIGSASASLAIVVATVAVMGLLGEPFGTLSEPRTFWANKLATGFIDRWLSVLDDQTHVPLLVKSGRIYVPSPQCELLAVVGLAISGLRLALALRQREFSWSSALGPALILLCS